MALIEDISEIASSILQSIDGYLVDVACAASGEGSIVEVFVDTDKGMTADQCAQVNRHISSELERAKFDPGKVPAGSLFARSRPASQAAAAI